MFKEFLDTKELLKEAMLKAIRAQKKRLPDKTEDAFKNSKEEGTQRTQISYLSGFSVQP